MQDATRSTRTTDEPEELTPFPEIDDLESARISGWCGAIHDFDVCFLSPSHEGEHRGCTTDRRWSDTESMSIETQERVVLDRIVRYTALFNGERTDTTRPEHEVYTVA